jgi:hypothetical protein
LSCDSIGATLETALLQPRDTLRSADDNGRNRHGNEYFDERHSPLRSHAESPTARRLDEDP